MRGENYFRGRFSFTDYFRLSVIDVRVKYPSASHVTWRRCWRTFLPRCSRTFDFRESIKRRGAHSRKFHFRDGFQPLLPDAAGLSIYPRARGSLSRTRNSIFHADSNENPKSEASTKCQVSGIGLRRDRIPRVSRFDGSDRMAFLAIFQNISFFIFGIRHFDGN